MNIFHLNKSWMGGTFFNATERRCLYPTPHAPLPVISHVAVSGTDSVSIGPFLSSKWITSKPLLNRIYVLQLALLWSSGPSLTLALQSCSVWSLKWSQETWRGNWGGAGSLLTLDVFPNHSPPTLHFQVRSWKIEEGRKTEDFYPHSRGSRTCLKQFLFS